MDGPNCFINAGELEEEIHATNKPTENYFKMPSLDKISQGEDKEDIITSNPAKRVSSPGSDQDIPDRHRQMSTSLSSRSSCNSRKSKLRLCLEMNIKPNSSVDYDYFKESLKDEPQPITVTVDYPEDLCVTVNARIQKPELSEDIVESPAITISPILNDKSVRQNSEPPRVNQTILNSTFVKAASNSTMYYAIPEESEVFKPMKVNTGDHVTYKSPLRSSGNSTKSLYQTVLGGNDSMFGNLSIMSKNEKENLTNDSTRSFIDDHLSLSINSISRLYPVESMTPADKLANALHKLARYRGAWGIFEDEYRIVTHLIALNRLLKTTDAEITHTICSDDDYQELEGLISYFVKEKRFIIRSELLQTFALLYNMSIDIVDFISGSEIPVVVAREIALGNFMSKETYEYAVFFLQIITSGPLSESHYDCIGPGFYLKLIEIAYKAERYHCKPIADVLLYTLLTYHGHLREESNQWECLNLLAYKNIAIFGKFKKIILDIVVHNVGSNHRGLPIEKICQILRFLTDSMKCKSTKGMFSDSELDILLISLIHCFEEVQFNQIVPDVMLTVDRTLKLMKTESSGLDRLRRTLKRMKFDTDGSGDNRTGKLASKILNSIL